MSIIGRVYLDVELREGHVPSVRETDEETTCIQTSQARSGHHHYIRYAAKRGRKPETLSATQFCSEDTS
jgi:hypothetical protein